jgi:hypothetical protein
MEIMEANRELLRTLLVDLRLMKDRPSGRRARRLVKRWCHEAGIQYPSESGVRRKMFCPVDAARAAFYVHRLIVGTAQKRRCGLTQSSLKEETEILLLFLGPLLRKRNLNATH